MEIVSLPQKVNTMGFYPRTIIADTILINKFSLIHKFFHISNESYSNREDKIYKVRIVPSRLIQN